jgi:hypothetical protein
MSLRFILIMLIALLALSMMLEHPAFRRLSPAGPAPDLEARLDAILGPRASGSTAPAVLIGAGDISVCGQVGDMRTAALVERLLERFPEAAVFTAGDNIQTGAEIVEYYDCFDPSWGRFKERIHPSPGNHDWDFDHGAGYLMYFGPAAGSRDGYYSYDLADWHVVSLNSNCRLVDCAWDSEQARWLRADLRASGKACTLLTWHHPLRSSGTVPIEAGAETFWRIAAQSRAEVVVNGHDHFYERLAPLDGSGRLDRAAGMRSFIVGTGGAWLNPLGERLESSEALDHTTRGVIVFFLYPGRYEWLFVPTDGGTFIDAGSGDCR